MYTDTLVAIDVEATGLNEFEDEIIEVAAVRFRGDSEIEVFERLIKPTIDIPYKISRLTHITTEMVANAPAFADIRSELREFIGTSPVIGHSIDFDVRMLAGAGLSLPQAKIDTFDLATLVVPAAGSFKLADLVSKYQAPMRHTGDAHRALYDTRMAHALFCRLYELLCAHELVQVEEVLRLTSTVAKWPLRPIFESALRHIAGTSLQRKITARAVRSLDDYEILEPTNSSQAVAASTIAKIFSTQGVLGRLFNGYEQRAPQVTMSQAVAESLNRGQHTVVEAGTGTGKGLAYLVPAALHALERGQRVVLATHTINLQDQLFFKDIPALTRIFDAERAQGNTQLPDVELRSAILKGRSNYLCIRRLEEAKRAVAVSEEEVRPLLKVTMWSHNTNSGDRSEIPLFDKEMVVWDRLHASFDLCNGPGCEYFDQCWFFHARRRAEAAHLVVVNHALLLADMVADRPVLPTYEHLVIDEAHNLEDVATDQFGWSVTQQKVSDFFDALMHEGGPNQAEGLLSRLPGFLKGSDAGVEVSTLFTRIVQKVAPTIERGRMATSELFDALTVLVTRESSETGYDARLRVTPAIRAAQSWQRLIPASENVDTIMRGVQRGLDELNSVVLNLADSNLPDYDMLQAQTTKLWRFATEFVQNMAIFMTGSDENAITWMNYQRNRNILTIALNPLEVATLLRERLFDKKASVVLTSATLSVNGGYDYMRNRLGIPEANELLLDSPYDYERQAVVYIPQDMPDIKDSDYQTTMEAAILATGIAAAGRTLVLFTATSALRNTYHALLERFNEHDINLIGQGIDGSNKVILERFKSEPRSVLFGTASFWEGVDVAGDALSALVITKLPFAVPTDPIYAARAEQFSDAFREFSIPQSILKFKQGFGRLVRAQDDCGVVVVLDKRLVTKRYGEQFLQSLPPTTVRTGPVAAISSLVRRCVRPLTNPADSPVAP